jgi:hypothetical protein
MTRRTGREGLHTRVVQDKRDAEILREVAAEIRAARVARTVERRRIHWRGTLDALAQSEADDWYAAEVERMRERAPA